MSFSFDSVRESGSELAEVVRAYLVLDEIFQAWGMKQAVLALDGSVETLVQYDALLAVEETLHRSVSWVVGGREGGRLARIEKDQALYSEYLKEYEAVLPEGLSNPEQKRYRETLDRYYDAGFTIGLPDRLAKYGYLPAGLRIVDICLGSGAPVPEVARLYFKIGQSSQIFPLVRLCDDKTFAGRWDSLALRIIRNSLLDSLWSLTRTVVGQLGSEVDETWVDRGLALARKHSPVRRAPQGTPDGHGGGDLDRGAPGGQRSAVAGVRRLSRASGLIGLIGVGQPTRATRTTTYPT